MDFEDLISEEDLNPITPPSNEEELDTPPIEDTPPETPSEDTDEVDEKDEISESYFNFLKEVNVLDIPDDFEFTGKPEELEKALEITKSSMQNKVAEALWNKLPEDFKPLLQYGLEGGSNLDAYLKAYATPIDYENYPIESAEDQKKIVFESFKLTSNYEDAKILKMIKSLEISGDLEEAAGEAKEDLISYQSTRKANFLQEQQAQKIKEQEETAKYNSVLAENIDKTSYESLRKNRIKQVLLNPITVDNRTTTEFDSNLDSILSNPDHLVQLANIVADYNPKIGFNFDRMKKQLKSESTTEFKQLIKERLDKPNLTGSSSKQTVDESKI